MPRSVTLSSLALACVKHMVVSYELKVDDCMTDGGEGWAEQVDCANLSRVIKSSGHVFFQNFDLVSCTTWNVAASLSNDSSLAQ